METEKLIETSLPLQEINLSAIKEKAGTGHPGNLHLWWNRSPIRSAEALLLAALLDVPETKTELENLQDLVKGIADGEPEAEQAAAALLQGRDLPGIVDPFCGSGGLSLAAQRPGLRVQSSDTNAVAVLLTEAACSIPARFAAVRPVHPCAEKPDADRPAGPAALAEDILYYGGRMLEQARAELGDMYPDADGEAPLAWVHVRTAECPNPACRCRMPLASSYVLSRTAGNAYRAEPVLEDGAVRFRVLQEDCPPEKQSNKLPGQMPQFTCPACGAVAADDYLRAQGRAGRLGTQLMAVGIKRDGKKVFLAPDAGQTAAAAVDPPQDLPAGEIACNSRWFSTPGFGLTNYTDLYTARQLRLLCYLCDRIPEVQDRAASDALAAGMSASGGPLASGGTGALAYGQAVGVYLALAVSRMANYHSTECSWDTRSGYGRAAFNRQMLPMVWTFAEENPFSDTTGNFRSMICQVAESVRNLPQTGSVQVCMQDALTMAYPADCLFFSELPYYDHVGYADLSDYFHIWLRRCLQRTDPVLFDRIVTSKEELCSIPEHYENNPVLARQRYEAQLGELIRKLAAAITPDFPSILFWQYSRADDAALRPAAPEKRDQTPLEYLLTCLVQAGCSVTAIWPVRNTAPGGDSESVRIVIAFRKRTAALPPVTRRSWIAAMKRALPERLNRILPALSNEKDRRIAAAGCGMKVFTQYETVLNADGSHMSVHDALFLTVQEAEAYGSRQSGKKQTCGNGETPCESV